MNVWKGAGIAVGAVGVVVGAGFAAQRVAARRLRMAPDPDAGREFVEQFESTHRVATHDGGELFVVEHGHGPPIVLVHGVTLSIGTWAKQWHSLSEAGFRVVAYEQRGHGGSTVGRSGHSVENLGADLKCVIEELDLHDAVVVGHSMGGIAVQSFCIDFADVARQRVAGIVLLSTLARSPVAANRRLARTSGWAIDRWPDSSAALRSRDLGLVLTRVGFGRNPAARDIESTREMILATSSSTRRSAIAALIGFDLTKRLCEIDRPTLVIGGSADVMTPLAESRRLARHIRGARLEVLDGGGHMLMFERAEQLDDLITDFAHQVPRGDQAGSGSAVGAPG